MGSARERWCNRRCKKRVHLPDQTSRAGDNFARLCLNIAEADLLVFFIQRQMRMVTTGKFAQGSQAFTAT